MRRLVLLLCCLGTQELIAQSVVRGTVTDAVTGRPLAGVTVQLVAVDNLAGRVTTLTNDSGRFELRTDRRGTHNVVARRPGFAPFGLSIQVVSDTFALSVSLVPLARSLPEVAVIETEVDQFVRDLRLSYKAVGRSRIFDAAQMDHTGQLLAGPFLLGQAGIVAVSCQNSKSFIPEGKVRTEPVLKEPADVWWPCYLSRGKPVPIRIRIDGGPAEPFDAISSRVLSEFAAIAVIQGGNVVAYTKDYALRKRR